MTSVVERVSTTRSLLRSPQWTAARTPITPTEDATAAWVQNALSTSDRRSLGSVSAAARSAGLYTVSGDFVDLMEVDDKLVALLGDVSGKGVAASLVASVVLASVQHHVDDVGAQPSELLGRVHRSIAGMLDRTERLVTLAIAVIDPEGLRATIASAGHYPVMLASDVGISHLGPTSPPLGTVMPSRIEIVAPFVPGSALLLASDGITEQRNDCGVEFGLDRLGRLAHDARFCEPAVSVDVVHETVRRFSGRAARSDDQAAVVVRAGQCP